MSRWKKEIGVLGERAAAQYLRDKGHRIIHQNYTCPLGEIDLVTMDEGTLVFVEVRAKTTSSFGIPEESVDREKLKKLSRLARHYLSKLKEEKNCRIDLVAVEIDRQCKTPLAIRHIKGII